MEDLLNRNASKAETVQVPTKTPHTDSISEAQVKSVEVPTQGQDAEKIREIKERLLKAGHVVIGPIEGDPFTLSRDHVPTGRGVTTYLPDGTIQKTSIEEYRADLAKGRRAAQFFESRRQEGEDAVESTPSSPLDWLKFTFSKLWSKLWRGDTK